MVVEPKTWRLHWWKHFGHRLRPVFLVSNDRQVCFKAISYMLIIVTAKQLVMRCPLLQFIFPGIGTICIIKLLPLFILWVIMLNNYYFVVHIRALNYSSIVFPSAVTIYIEIKLVLRYLYHQLATSTCALCVLGRCRLKTFYIWKKNSNECFNYPW